MMDPNISKEPNAVTPSPLFREIARDLLSESYALENSFNTLSLTEIGNALEELHPQESIPEGAALCKDHYCMLLMELELQGFETIPPSLEGKTLAEIAEIDQSLLVAANSPSSEETALEQLRQMDNELLPEMAESSEPAFSMEQSPFPEALPEALEDEIPEEMEKELQVAPPPDEIAESPSEMPASIQQNTSVTAPQTPQEQDIDTPLVPQIELTGILTDLMSQPSQPLEEQQPDSDRALDLSAMEASPIEHSPESEPTMISSEFTHFFTNPLLATQPANEQPVLIPVATPETASEYTLAPTVTDYVPPDNSMEISAPEPALTTFTPLEAPPSVLPAVVPGVENPSDKLFAPFLKTVENSLAKNYLTLAMQFNNALEVGNSSLSTIVLRKLVGQFLCSIAETETYAHLMERLADVWENRKTIIKALLKTDSFHLNETLTAFIAKKAEHYEDWLYEGKFPYTSVLSSLRYLILTDNLTKLSPSSLDLGVLIYFFGYAKNPDTNSALTQVPLANSLKLSGLSEKESTELAFRLMRIERLKAKALDAYCNFDTDHVEAVMDDVQHILKLLKQIKNDFVADDAEMVSDLDVA